MSCRGYAHRTTDDLNNGYGVFINNHSGFNCLFSLQYATPLNASYGTWMGYGSYASTPTGRRWR